MGPLKLEYTKHAVRVVAESKIPSGAGRAVDSAGFDRLVEGRGADR